MSNHPLDEFQSWNADKKSMLIVSLLRAGRWEYVSTNRLLQDAEDSVIPVHVYEDCGEICMLRKSYRDALECFSKAGNAVLLQKLGDACVQAGEHECAVCAFVAAGAYDKLIALGKTCVESKDFASALKAFQACRDKGQLEQLGDRVFSLWRKNPSDQNTSHLGYLAKSAFFHAGAIQKMVQVGKMAIGINNDLAFHALQEAEASPYLIQLGNAQLEKGDWERASKSFFHADAYDHLFECFKIGILQEPAAHRVFYATYRVWGLKPPHDRCQQFAISLLQKDDPEIDVKAFDILKCLSDD